MPSPPAIFPPCSTAATWPRACTRGTLAGAFAVSTAGDCEGLPSAAELALLDTAPDGSTQR